MKLYSANTSSASFRVRIALNLKGIAFDYIPVRLRFQEGEHRRPAYLAINPQGKVPVLIDGDVTISQTMAILEYLEEVYPDPPLLPADRPGRARVRSLAQFVACEIQPLNNLRVEQYLEGGALSLDPDRLRAWRRHWITVGFDALEVELARSPSTGLFCHGDSPTMADCFLVPQVANSQRPTVGLDLAVWPTIERIWRACLARPEFDRALPAQQPDYEPVVAR